MTRTDPSLDSALADLVSAVSSAGAQVQTSSTGPGLSFSLDGGAVTLGIDPDDLVGLVAGRADAALLYLAGRVTIDGDPAVLVEVGSRVRLGHGRPLVDPDALDPDAVSAAIADVPVAHLDAVMAGPFRPIVLEQVFRRLPEFLRTEKAARVSLAVAFEVGGRGDDGLDRYVVRIVQGSCSVVPDPAGEQAADVTLVLTGAQFLRLVLGHLNPVRAVLNREVIVRGELFKALAFNSVMRIPGI